MERGKREREKTPPRRRTHVEEFFDDAVLDLCAALAPRELDEAVAVEGATDATLEREADPFLQPDAGHVREHLGHACRAELIPVTRHLVHALRDARARTRGEDAWSGAESTESECPVIRLRSRRATRSGRIRAGPPRPRGATQPTHTSAGREGSRKNGCQRMVASAPTAASAFSSRRLPTKHPAEREHAQSGEDRRGDGR